MLELRHVTKRFSGIPAVDGVSLTAPAREWIEIQGQLARLSTCGRQFVVAEVRVDARQ